MLKPVSLATLGDLRRHDHALRANCERCQYGPLLDTDGLIARFGEGQGIIGWRPALRCTRCGATDCSLTLVPLSTLR
jgi:hypothetical protein